MSENSVNHRHTLREVARIVDVSLETVWRWTLRGVRGRRLQSYMLGGRRYVHPADLAAFLANGKSAGDRQTPDLETRAENAGKMLDTLGVRRTVNEDHSSLRS